MSISNKVIDIANSLEFVNDYNTVGITGSNARITASGTGNLTIYATSSSTNSSIGAVILQNGGLSINASALATSSTAGGALTVAGGAAFAQNMFVAGGLSALNNSNTIGNIFTTGGNVGIGTNSPANTLDVNGTFRVSSSDTWQSTMSLRNTSNNHQYNLALGGSSNATIGSRSFALYDATQDKFRMIINSVGNVGIGTVSPGSALDVLGTVNATLFTGGNLSVTNSSIGNVVTVNANVTNNSVTNLVVANQTVSNTTLVAVTSSNVLVTGTISTANLRGTGVFATNMGASGTSTTTLLVTGSSTVGSVLISGGGLVANFNSNTVGSIFTTGGNVGIANTAPSYTLDVSGTFRVNGSGVSSILNSTNSDVIQLQNANGTGNSAIQILDNSGTTRMNIGYGNTGGNTVYAGVGYLSANTGIPIKLIAGGRTADPVTLNASDNSVTINTTTSSVNQYSGALKVVGGTGIQENLFVGGNATVNLDLNVNGAINGAAASSSTFAYLTLTATDEAINLSTGSMVTFGGITIQATRDATDASNGGGLLIAGGASVGKTLFVGTSISTGAINVSGVVSTGTLAGNTVTSGNVAAYSGTVASLLASNFSVGSLAISTLATAANVSALNVSVATLKVVNLTTGNINFTGVLSQNGVPYIGSQWVGTSGTISFGTAGTSLVGINTTSPAFALDVSGGSRIVTGVTAGPSTFTSISSGNSNFTGITAGNINFTGNLFQNGSPYLGSQWAGTSGNISYTRGNVGFGTTSASSTLTVVGDADISGITSLANLVATNTTIANLNVGNINTGISSYFSGSYVGANNVTSATSITGLKFNSTDIQSFTAQASISVLRSTGGNFFETVALEGYQTDAGWSLLTSSIGDISGITFSIDASGQVLYTSTNATNWSSTTIRYSAQQISLNGNFSSLARPTTGSLVMDSLQLNNTSDTSLGSNNGSLYSLGGAVFAKGVIIKTTNDTVGLGTGGGLTILGGVAVSKSLVVGTNISSASVSATNVIGTNISGTNVGIGTSSPSSALHVNGSIIGTFAVHVSFYGIPTLYDSNGTTQAGNNTNIYLYPKFPSNNNQNWTPRYNNQTRLSIPYNGIYYVQFTYFCTSNGSRELFISKNLNNNNDLNIGDDRLLCASNNLSANENSISATAYLTTSDFINFGFFSSSGDNSAAYRCVAQVTLIQRIS